MIKNTLLYIALIVSILTYTFWHYLPKGFFYVGNAFFICIISFCLFRYTKNSFVSLVIFLLSINNLIDELFFDNTKISLNEYLTAFIIIVISLKIFFYDRKRTDFNR